MRFIGAGLPHVAGMSRQLAPAQMRVPTFAGESRRKAIPIRAFREWLRLYA